MPDPLRLALTDLVAAHGSIRAWAAATGADHSLASAVLRGTAKPTPALLRAMGWRRVVTFEPVDKTGDAV